MHLNALKPLTIALGISSAALFGVSCEPDEPDTPGEAIEQMGEEVGDAVDDAADEVEDAIEDVQE
jgi:hypothetical protein